MYLNRKTKELMLSVLASGSCLKLASEHEIFDDSARNELARMADKIKELTEEATKNVDQSTLRAMYHTAENAHIVLLPRTSPKARKEYVLCERDALKRLVLSSMLDCGMCVLEGREIKKCATRRDLISCNIEPIGNGECPFREG